MAKSITDELSGEQIYGLILGDNLFYGDSLPEVAQRGANGRGAVIYAYWVSDPSGLFLHHRADSVPGTAVTVTMDGKRALLAEVQALVAPSHMPTPRRAVSGLDAARVSMILAVLERRCSVQLSSKEVYAATIGGMRTTEPTVDLALALAVASAAKDTALPAGMVVLGEVGLAGEVRRVVGVDRRLAEAARLGFTSAIVPADQRRGARDDTAGDPPGMRVTRVTDVFGAMQGAFDRRRKSADVPVP